MHLEPPLRRNRNARIVATLGPASSDAAGIRSPFHAGADVFRTAVGRYPKQAAALMDRIIEQVELDPQ